MRHGPHVVGGDKFRLGPILEHGTLLFGRRTWDHFSNLWPNRARCMVDRPLTDWVRLQTPTADLVVIGSESVVDELAAADLVDEYRLLTFPTAVGSGRRLFTGTRHLSLVRAEQVGPTSLSILSTR